MVATERESEEEIWAERKWEMEEGWRDERGKYNGSQTAADQLVLPRLFCFRLQTPGRGEKGQKSGGWRWNKSTWIVEEAKRGRWIERER